MSFKRKFEADEYDDRSEEECYSEVDEDDEEDEDDDDDEYDDLENLDHVRNLEDGLLDERPPPSKRPKVESNVQKNAEKQTGEIAFKFKVHLVSYF